MDRKIVELMIAGKGANEIIRELKVGGRRVRRLKEMAEGYGYLNGSRTLPQYPEALFPEPESPKDMTVSEADQALLAHREWIRDRLAVGWRPITVFEELPLRVSRSSFYRFLSRHDLEKVGEHVRRVIPEIVHAPGEALLLDWGKLRDVIDGATGKKRTLWAFVGVLGFSRFMMVRLVWTNETATTLSAIESMFQELGGVPSRLTSDNPKCFALEASDYEPLLNPAFERFASYYGTLIECLPPRDPQKKGKVERLMPFVRRLYEAHGEAWLGLEEAQDYLDRKVAIANERKHGTTGLKPVESFLNQEAASLRALPALGYEIEEFYEGKVRKDGHVRVANKYYSVGAEFIGKEVICLANSTQISIYCGGKLIEVHGRLQGGTRSKSTKEHHLSPWEQSMKETSVYRKRAQALGPDVDQLILAILSQGQGFIDTRKVWGILSLDKTHSPEAINEACRQAMEMHSYGYRTVKSFLKLSARSHAPSPPAAERTSSGEKKQNKFVRSMAVYEEQLKLIH